MHVRRRRREIRRRQSVSVHCRLLWLRRLWRLVLELVVLKLKLLRGLYVTVAVSAPITVRLVTAVPLSHSHATTNAAAAVAAAATAKSRWVAFRC